VDFLQDLNPVQREAAKATNGPMIIIAGAGSGKTRVLTYRIAYLIECGVPPYQILALTFTNKAANEMKSRIAKLVGERGHQVWMGTFHSIFARILRKEAEHLGYTNSFTIYDSDDSLSAVKKILDRLNISAQQYNPNAIRSRISAAKNNLVSPKEFEELSRDIFDEKTSLVYREYTKRLKQSNAMDFDDLLIKPIELFERKPEILERYQNRFTFSLVDEFQDTNRAQYRVTKLLGDKRRNVCVVGDDAQSIYSFRGADIRNILDFERDYPDCQTFRLEQNYRSTKSILHAADQLIRYNEDRLKKNLWTQNPQGEAVTVLQCADEKDEGAQILQAIQEELPKRKLDLKNVAILYRTNSQSRALEDVLRRNTIPYTIVGGTRFYERKEIKDILAYLRLLTNPSDEESLLRVINFPTRGIGDTSVEHLQLFAHKANLGLFHCLAQVELILELTDRAQKSLIQFRQLIEKYQSLRSKMSFSELTRSLVDELGILRMYKEEGTDDSRNRWENVQELLSAILEFSAVREEATLESFLEEVSLVSDIDRWEDEKNSVTLMTLHASKGLEFPLVFVAGLEEGLLPFYSSQIDKLDLEEERRLFYVGITRAEQKLYLTHTKLRYRFGDVSYPSESRFLSEIGKEFVEVRLSRGAVKNPESAFDRYEKTVSRFGRAKTPAREDSYLSDAAPDYESESQVELELRKGALVRHELFGRGKIINVSGSRGEKKAVVDFDEYGIKNLILKFANLKPA
jgi:DNA helicase-2/ATP-dependent DNA helicase PcrA